MGTALPVLAQNNGTNAPLPPASSKAGNKTIPMSSASAASATARAKDQIHKNVEVTLTPDVSRGAVSATQLAKQEPALKKSSLPPAQATAHGEFHAVSATPSAV